MSFESGDYIYAAILLGVTVVSHRFVRAVNYGFLFKVVVVVGTFVMLRDFYDNYGWRLNTIQTDLWRTVSPEWSLIFGVATGLILVLRDRYAPMLTEAGILVWNMQRKAKAELDQQRREIEADLLRQKRESSAALERERQQAQEELKRKADADWERLQECLRETKEKLKEEEERLKREHEEMKEAKDKSAYGDPYEILSLLPDASPAEIKKRYRELVAQYHPDKATQTTPEIQKLAEEQVKEINWAYGRLKT